MSTHHASIGVGVPMYLPSQYLLVTDVNVGKYFTLSVKENTLYSFEYFPEYKGPSSGKTFSNVWKPNNRGYANSNANLCFTAEEPLTVKFQIYISSEAKYDYFYVVGGNNQTIVYSAGSYISTAVQTITLATGQSLKIEYMKDGSVNTADDVGLIYNLQVLPDSHANKNTEVVPARVVDAYISTSDGYKQINVEDGIYIGTTE